MCMYIIFIIIIYTFFRFIKECKKKMFFCCLYKVIAINLKIKKTFPFFMYTVLIKNKLHSICCQLSSCNNDNNNYRKPFVLKQMLKNEDFPKKTRNVNFGSVQKKFTINNYIYILFSQNLLNIYINLYFIYILLLLFFIVSSFLFLFLLFYFIITFVNYNLNLKYVLFLLFFC